MIISICIQEFPSDCRRNKPSYTSHRVCNTQCMRNMRRTDIIQICFRYWKLKSHKRLKSNFFIFKIYNRLFYLSYNSESDNGNNVTTNRKIKEAKTSWDNRSKTIQTFSNVFPAIASTFKGITR